MEAIMCAKGIHVLTDPTQVNMCPHCAGVGENKPTDKFKQDRAEPKKTEPKEQTADVNGNRVPRNESTNDGVTKRYTIPDEKGAHIDPVVGWLVCVEGVDKGRDYRIRCGYNSIGRDPSMLIHINGDDGITRLNHATILYDIRDKVFTIERKEAKHPIRVNEKRLAGGEMELSPFDLIDFGETKLRFVPFCGEHFDWS